MPKYTTMKRRRIFFRLLLACSLLLSTSAARAQYVSIPDSNFGNWLYYNVDSFCMRGNSISGWLIDTTCPAVVNLTSLSCYDKHISSLEGIQYFKHLTYLSCGENNITYIPSLPDSLYRFFAGVNMLRSLPPLPPNLTDIDVSWNPGLRIPQTLPSGLLNFICGYDSLTTLPTLPATLLTLSCDNNKLTTLPSTLPPGIQSINVNGNQILNLPAIPASVTNLACEGNPIASLPVLPPRLANLDCGNTLLTSLPPLPLTLKTLYCESTSITALPNLPDSLTLLNCAHDGLTYLPALGRFVNYLDCSYNQLSTLPVLPDSLSSLNCKNNSAIYCLPRIQMQRLSLFYISGTSITCLPDRFSAMSYDISPDSLPSCTASSGCEFYYNLAGSIHSDNSPTCALDQLYPGASVTNMKVQLMSGNKIIQQFYTFNSGGYSFKTDSLTNYTITLDTTGLPLAIACPSSGSIPVSLSAADSVQGKNNFGVVCDGFDYGFSSIAASRFRATFPTTVHIEGGNMSKLLYNVDCGGGISGTVTTTISGSARYLGPAPGAIVPSTVSGNTLTYDFTNLDTIRCGSIDIIVVTDTNAVTGTPICFTVIIIPARPDHDAIDDTIKGCFNIIDSWDPNHKNVYPSDSIASGSWLTYTVDFQNTGTDTAYTVVVRDTLSRSLDASSFLYLASSSKAVIQLIDNAMTFTFPHINLVDSATNPPLSSGWIQYKVKTKPALTAGTTISNTAYIYFDMNPPVSTNTTVNVIDTDLSLGIVQTVSGSSITLSPNPNRGSFVLQTINSMGKEYMITDMLGHVIAQQKITADKEAIQMPEAAEGIYTLSVRGAQALKFVVMK